MSTSETSDLLGNLVHWPFVLVLSRMAMSVGIGVFIGLEREHSQKAGVRTFALISLMCCLGGLMGRTFAGIAMAFVAMSVMWMNYRQMVKNQKLALTTSAALTITAFSAILFGEGHVFTPAVASIATAALLAWKQPISRFALGLSDQELRSAILLAILTFIVYPVLPAHPIDPWGLIEAKSNWASVIIIAGIGFINYILMKALGARGMEITAFFGGLVNSRKVIVELSTRLRENSATLLPTVHRGILLATAAMLLRNGIVIAVFSSQAVVQSVIPLTFMLLMSALLWWRVPVPKVPEGEGSPLVLESPFRLSVALKFGVIFLLLNVVGALAQRQFGSRSFYFVSIAGGLLSSGSSIASAANLISRHEIDLVTGIHGIILSSLTSVLVNIPLVRRLTNEPVFKRKICYALAGIAAVGLVGVFVNDAVVRWFPYFH